MIKIDHLVKKYGKIVALNDFNLDIIKGEVLGIFGENGSGKSTLAKVIAHHINYNKGQVLYQEITVDDIRFVPALTAFYPGFTILENLEYFLGIKQEKIISVMKNIYDEIDFDEIKDKKYRACSTGMKQRTALILAILSDCKVLILDEPTIGIDLKTKLGLKKYIAMKKQEGTTIVLISHDVDFLSDVCDRIVCMSKGTVRGIFKIGEIQLQDIFSLRFKGDANHHEIASILKDHVRSFSENVYKIQVKNETDISKIIGDVSAKGLIEVIKIRQTFEDFIHEEEIHHDL